MEFGLNKFIRITGCNFVAIPTPDCPCSVWNDNVCENLSECTASMHYGDICKASTTLPDGNFNYDVQNCGLSLFNRYNVFKCEKGKKRSF